MNRKFAIHTKWLPLCLIVVTVLMIGFLAWNHVILIKENAILQITDLSAESEDGAIVLHWAPLTEHQEDGIEITVQSNGTYQTVEISSSESSYIYTEGVHGRRYDFSVRVKGAQDFQTASAMFLHFAELPDMPLISIETANGEDPLFHIVEAPAGNWGYTATENEYVAMQIKIYEHGGVKFQSTGQIRIRGNTSATAEKKPYKIKLDQSADLLFRQNSKCMDTEWLLVDAIKGWQMEAGSLVSDLCGMEWQPNYIPVNVMLNGNYIGSYHLVESVKVSAGRLPLSSHGFLIENNAYWWDADGLYFRTPYQIGQLGYTFQYPQVSNAEGSLAVAIRDYVITAESALREGRENYTDYFDVNSYAGWLLAHDILGTYDAGGSNMYIYTDNMNAGSPLKAGPLWDFSSVFWLNDTWARIHKETFMHYDVLLQKDEFREAYLQKWNGLSDTLCEDVQKFLHEYTQKYGKALQDSWDLDSERWQTEPVNVQESVNNVNAWFAERKVWLDTAMQDI